MNTKIWIGVVVVVLLILVVAAVAFLVLRQDEPELDGDTASPTPAGGDLPGTLRPDEPELDANAVQLSAGCNDIIDVSVLPDDKKMEACKYLTGLWRIWSFERFLGHFYVVYPRIWGSEGIVDRHIYGFGKFARLQYLIDSRRRDLEARGFVPGKCRVDSFEVVDCDPALGTELICTVRCGEDAE